MPKHSNPEEKAMEVESDMKAEKKQAPKRKSGMRKLEPKEKEILKKHLDLHMKNADRSDLARARMKVMRSKAPIKSMAGLHKLLGK
jgi:hypothetical protein